LYSKTSIDSTSQCCRLILYMSIHTNSEMPSKKNYGEPKRRFTMTLTRTAINWLESQQKTLEANSLSDVIERMARNKKPS
jgi:uncharacterized protein YjiS (DUF1127 family)